MDALRLNVISEPTVKDLEPLVRFGLAARLSHISRWSGGSFEDSLPYSDGAYLASGPTHTGWFDVVSKTMKLRAHEEWPNGRPVREWEPTTATSKRRSALPVDWDERRDAIARRFELLLSSQEELIERASRARREAEAVSIQAATEARAEVVRARPAPVPPPFPYGVSFHGAELLVADWMRHLGILDAHVTPSTADGGVDVDSDTHVAQVKHYKGNVSVVALRELFGVASARTKTPLFFTSAGYTGDAIRFADAIQMPLFVYNAELGTLTASNLHAQALV